ncbi:ATPase domain-containing protein [Haladaptatus sp. CMSO5]|uniref:ATPase domain-containing protein n=1 Tax=Haladaptatus sp. CMSO5 TaxID=3120514 RepID=UPI002FCE4922
MSSRYPFGQVSSGNETLDKMLDGGFPQNRSMLITGGPGTGKTTLAMQFLQEGLRNGDTCLFVSTEQKPAELRDTFAPFDFDLDHENLTLTSIHARPGYTLEDDEEQLTIETLEEESVFGGGFSAPFTSKYISKVIELKGPADRVVVDSISGLRAISDDDDVFRRAVLDLIHLFTDRFEATSVLVSETDLTPEGSPSELDSLEYAAHGVLRLWLEDVRNSIHRYLQVRKVRGINHDMRPYEIEFNHRGVNIIPRQRSVPDPFIRSGEAIPTGITGLDRLLGGGFIGGETVVLEHDGRANVNPLTTKIVKQILDEEDGAIVYVPEAGNRPEQVRNLFAGQVGNVESLLEEDKLFIIDMISPEDSPHENIFAVDPNQGGLKYLLQLIDDRRGDRSLVTVMNTEAPVRTLGEDMVASLHEWQEANLLKKDNLTIYQHNPRTMSDELHEFLANNARHVLETWLHENGLQYITLKKSPTGYLGSTLLVDYINEDPFVRIQSPPGYRNDDQ